MKKSFGTKNCFPAVACVLFWSGVCLAFSDGDLQYWSTADFSFEMNEDWKVNLQEELRLGNGAGNLYYHHSDVGFVYRGLGDWIDLGFNYRQVVEKDSDDTCRPENRPHLNLTLKGKLFDLLVSDRSRVEYRDRDNKDDLWRYRNKLTVKFPFTLTEFKLQPYVADEVFIECDSRDFNKNRIYAGFDFNLTKDLKGGIFYMLQSTRGNGRWNDLNVIGTKLKFSF